MRLFTTPDNLPAALLGRDSFFSTAAWWRTVAAAGVAQGATAVFAVHGDGDGAVLWPLLRRADGGYEALTNPYTCLYQPAAGPIAQEGGADLHGAGRALARLGRGGGLLRLDALDPDWPGLPAVLAGARAGGMVALRFDHFGNWYEPIDGRDWRAYLAGRPGALRETIRRRLRDAERNVALSFALLCGADAIEAGIAEYEAVYSRSWKEPEPFPHFNAELMRQTAREGALRLAVLRNNGAAIAVQMWVVHQGIAAVLKLAHDEAFKPLSPGTVLTAWTLRQLIEAEGVAGLDFGRGDDPYKQLWTSQRRQRIGVVLATPWHPAGIAALLRHAAGRVRAKLRR